jgi:hypothetical protein
MHITEVMEALDIHGHDVVECGVTAPEKAKLGSGARSIAVLTRDCPNFLFGPMKFPYAFGACWRWRQGALAHRLGNLNLHHILFLPAGAWVKRRLMRTMPLAPNASLIPTPQLVRP